MTNKRPVPDTFVADVKSGMGVGALMEKYRARYGTTLRWAGECGVAMSKYKGRSVEKRDIDTNELLATYPTIAEAARNVYGDGFSIAADIGKCCRGKAKTAYGYIWRYCEQEGDVVK